ncbi:MAG: hypothetical protein KGL40_04410 [Rhodocyclaceae bacterium]|nr:hypothetical protein [Rhodocyclaceae bacterium]
MNNTAATPSEPDDIKKLREALKSLPRDKRSKSRAQFDALLPDIIKAIHEDQHAVKKVWKQLKENGFDACLGTFNAWLLEQGVIPKKAKPTDPSAPSDPR